MNVNIITIFNMFYVLHIVIYCLIYAWPQYDTNKRFPDKTSHNE